MRVCLLVEPDRGQPHDDEEVCVVLEGQDALDVEEMRTDLPG
jgi:hypothetical protein